MIHFLIRFIAAGSLVAVLPWIAQQFGDRTAGMILLFPAVTLSGFVALGLDHDNFALSEAAWGSFLALPAVGVFLLAVIVGTRTPLALPFVLSLAIVAWIGSAIVLSKVATRLGGEL